MLVYMLLKICVCCWKSVHARNRGLTCFLVFFFHRELPWIASDWGLCLEQGIWSSTFRLHNTICKCVNFIFCMQLTFPQNHNYQPQSVHCTTRTRKWLQSSTCLVLLKHEDAKGSDPPHCICTAHTGTVLFSRTTPSKTTLDALV